MTSVGGFDVENKACFRCKQLARANSHLHLLGLEKKKKLITDWSILFLRLLRQEDKTFIDKSALCFHLKDKKIYYESDLYYLCRLAFMAETTYFGPASNSIFFPMRSRLYFAVQASAWTNSFNHTRCCILSADFLLLFYSSLIQKAIILLSWFRL